MTEAEADPFEAYHRAGRRMTVARVIPATLAALTIAAGLACLPHAALAGSTPAAPAATSVVSTQTATAPEPATIVESQPPAALPQPAAAEVASAPPTPPPARTLAATGTPQWSIGIDTVGYQAEIDDCLWVRMELGTHAPVVGAHNYCGGDVVLGMAIGDTVTLSGVGLDGRYTVIAARDARAGDNAQTATSGLGGTVILQTCYWSADGAERLVALAPR